MKSKKESQLKEHNYSVGGMHCASCEVLIEKELLEKERVEFASASAAKNQVQIKYIGSKPSIEALNKSFKKNGYTFSEKAIRSLQKPSMIQINSEKQLIIDKEKLKDFLLVAGFSLLIILGFMGLTKSGFAALLSVNSQSSLPTFFVFGLLAGLSSCAALVGGIVLSMSKQWSQIYSTKNSTLEKLQPHLLFNLGRIVSFAFVGALLGAVGQNMQASPAFTSILTILVSVMMLFLGLQMLGVKKLQKFQFALPKTITKFVVDESNFKAKWMPFLIGSLTFLLPCGFTITSQSMALISSSPVQGSMIMLAFALGTLPTLLLIGLSSVKFTNRPHLSAQFLKIAGVLILFFALYNFNAQLNVLGLRSFSDINISSNQKQVSKDGFAPLIGGKQLLEMDALSYGYKPNYFKVKTGIPVRWEITDKGTSGCTNAIISKGLFSGEIKLIPGKVSIKEFTPEKPGRYKFSCWMGMVSGIIDVVEKDGSNNNVSAPTVKEIPSGASGGCSGGCSGSCGGSCGNPGCSYAK